METQKPKGTEPISVVMVAVLTAIVGGVLLWFFRPTPVGRVVPLLIRVRPTGGSPDLSVMNGAPGDYQVELYGGDASGVDGGEPAPSSRIRWRYRGALSHLSLKDILKSGDRSGTAAQIPLPRAADGRLEPGSYVIEIAGRDSAGNSYAGAQAFAVPASTGPGRDGKAVENLRMGGLLRPGEPKP